MGVGLDEQRVEDGVRCAPGEREEDDLGELQGVRLAREDEGQELGHERAPGSSRDAQDLQRKRGVRVGWLKGFNLQRVRVGCWLMEDAGRNGL